MSTQEIQETASTTEATTTVTPEQEASTTTASQEELGKILEQTSEAETQTPEKAETTTQKDETKGKPLSEEEIKAIQEENARLSKQVQDKENYIRNRESIIQSQNQLMRDAGLLTDKAKALRSQAEQTANPAEVAEMVFQAQKAEDQAAQMQARHAFESNKAAILSRVPDYDSLIPDIVEVCKEENYDPSLIEAFKNAPYNEPVHFVIAFANAARQKKRLRELEEQNKNLKRSPEEITKKIAQAASSGPGITASSGSAGAEKLQVTSRDIPRLSKAQLEEILNQK